MVGLGELVLIVLLAITILLLIWVIMRSYQNKQLQLGLPKFETRTSLAMMVVGISMLGIIILGYVVISTAIDPADAGKQVMNAVLPLLGTWVGTVMAFYFSRENYESAAQNTRDTFQAARTSDEVLRSTPVTDKMIKWNDADIFHKELAAGALDQGRKGVVLVTSLTDLENAAKAKGKEWHRIPIVTSDKYPLYVVHDSTINEFIRKQAIAGTVAADLNKLTLDDLYNDPDFQIVLTESISVVNDKTTMADAKAAMSQSQHCQDVFITHSGTRTESILGWLTNVDIEKAGTV